MADRFVARLAHIGAELLLLLVAGGGLAGCGTTGTPGGNDGDGETASGGAASGGSNSGGSNSGGSASGGAGSGGDGGASSGGTSSGGTGGVAGIVNACPGAPAPASTVGLCRVPSDCINGGLCQATGPDLTGICGACFASPMECATDPDCGDGNVCVIGPDQPCQCMGRGLVCAPACTSDSCEAGEVCGEDGHCGPASCADDGFVCGTDLVCAPERATDLHGCAPSFCDGDGFTCSDDTICDAARTGTDAHHCAPRSCETEGYTCPEGKTCEQASTADTHGCRLIHCTEGVECPENYRCQEDAAATGCVQLTCAADSECDCGACVLGRCEVRLFGCYTLPS